jgi:hypothetical protein
MTETQARELATLIATQFPFHIITVVQSADMRNAPQNWFIGIKPGEDYRGEPLLIHSKLEWNETLLALHILSAYILSA